MSTIATNPKFLAEQYASDLNLRIRMDTHRKFTVGPKLEESVNHELALVAGMSVLDMGTGPGDFPARLKREGHVGRIVGVDQSPGMIEKAKSYGVEVEFMVADAMYLPFGENAFDRVTARHMLYHVPDVTRALHEAKRVLKPGGIFLAVTNGISYMREFREAIAEAAIGMTGEDLKIMRDLVEIPSSSGFYDVNGPPRVQEVFGNVKVTGVDSILRFKSPEPIVRYFDTSRTMRGVGEAQWKRLSDAFANQVMKRLDKNGVWDVSKYFVLIQANRMA